ncbi:Hsp70 family protein [Micromonospora sp. CPCC 206061]|uniref:Hsp70 family protein n=1 Tax=Micromonospora sp. CPCC 206061 TaxID=3122410 RepID=UPI002FF258A6
MPADRTPTSGHALGIDFGTSHTVAVVRWPDGRARPLLVDGSPLLPSAVYAEPGGAFAVGRDALHSARLDPARFEPNPKRRIDEGTLLLGDREVPVADLVGAVLGRVAEEWTRTVGRARPEVTLTCPATWGATRRRLLADAAARAGFDEVRLVAEPVAAATYFAKVLGRDVPIGSVVVVHDFGAGTFDASVVARTSSGFEVLAVDGRDDIGGLDVDAAIIEHLQKAYADRDPDAWARLATPTTVEERRAKRQLWDDVRVAKERLSRSTAADLVVPLLDLEVHLTRQELEALAGPILEQTVRVTQGVMRWANLPTGRVAGVFLVGGSSRIPLMATLLHRALGEAPEAIEQPELVVAEGSILAGEALLASAPPAPGPTMQMRPVSPAPVSPAPVSAKNVGRVAVPGAQPPGRPRQQPPPPVAPTRPMPRFDEPTPPRYAPASVAPRVAAPAPTDAPRLAAYAPPRRPGLLLRLFRALIITSLLIVVPVAAGVIAFSLARDTSPANVIQGVLDWINSR